MIDNFEQISKLLKWDSDDEFYFLQIIKRKKDQPEEVKGNNNSARLVKSYYVRDLNHLMKIKDEVIAISKITNSRAGINLNKRSFEKTALQTVRTILDQMSNHNNKSAYRAFNTVCGKYTTGDKHWILDYDEGTLSDNEKNLIQAVLYEEQPIGDKVIDYIPTKQGTHIITKPFDLRFCGTLFDDFNLDVHKNNPTALFIP